MCPSSPKHCEVFFKPGMLNGKEVNSCAEYCASRGLKCVHSYQPKKVNYESKCSSFIHDKYIDEEGWQPGYITSDDYPYITPTCDMTIDDMSFDSYVYDTDNIGCVCGK